MDIEQYAELDVIKERIHQKHAVFVDEVYKDHLEDIVEVFHHFHAEKNIISYLYSKCKSILPFVNKHVPIHDFDNIQHKHSLIDLLIH
jgi:hypothetical protein